MQFVVRQVVNPIFFATVIIITAYLPLLGLERVEAKLFSPVAYTISYALIGALLCTLLLVPGLAFMALRKPSKPFHNPVLECMESRYRDLLDLPGTAVDHLCHDSAADLGPRHRRRHGRTGLSAQSRRRLAVAASAIAERHFLREGAEMASDLRDAVLEFPEVSYVITQIGRNDDRTDPWTTSHIEAPIGLKPYDMARTGDEGAIRHQLTTRLSQLPGMEVGVSQPIIDNVNELVSGAHSALVVKVFGEDLKETRRIADEIVLREDGQGTTQTSIVQEPPIPQIVFHVDRATAARYGINVADVANLIQIGVGGVRSDRSM